MQHDNRDHYTIAADEIIAEGTDLKVSILTLTAGQCVPWHHHSNVSDRFFCMEGPMVVETRVPLARIDKRAIGFRLWPAGQDHGTHDHPVELAPADDAFLYVFVVVDAPQQQMESHAIKKPATAAISPAPRPVTQTKRLIRASSIAVTSTWVAFEKSRVGSKMISGPAETPSD
jgi:hypothetical protein